MNRQKFFSQIVKKSSYKGKQIKIYKYNLIKRTKYKHKKIKQVDESSR